MSAIVIDRVPDSKCPNCAEQALSPKSHLYSCTECGCIFCDHCRSGARVKKKPEWHECGYNVIDSVSCPRCKHLQKIKCEPGYALIRPVLA